MPKFTILSRVDAFVDYLTEVEAATVEEAVDRAYEGEANVVWEHRGTIEFDARRVVALNEDGQEIEATARGRFT